MKLSLILPLAFALFNKLSAQQIDPASVSNGTREQWCVDQKQACPLLCLQTTNSETTTANDCDSDTLVWNCVCSNGQTPNETQYSVTIPFHECQTYIQQCSDKCGADSACVTNCRSQYTCGAKDPFKGNGTKAKPTHSKTSAASGAASSFSSFGGSGSSDGGSSKGGKTGAAGMSVKLLAASGQLTGLAMIAALVLTAFAVVL